MGLQSADHLAFLPAKTPSEAISRIYSLTGARDLGTRGEKRAILALRDALGLDVDTARTNAVMGQRIAEAWDLEWLPQYQHFNTITVEGLNVLLERAAEEYRRGSLKRLSDQRPSGLEGGRWAAFKAARSKIEAVNRISFLTDSGPEWLGPGSKEHKRVLINLAQGLAPHIDMSQSKTRLGAALAAEFGAPWTDECASTGETISLKGLNTILAGAELRVGKLGGPHSTLFGTPEEEGRALVAALIDGWRARAQPDGGRRVVWDARESIKWMEAQRLTRGPNDNEWQGFYFEARGRTILNAAFTPNPNPPRVSFGNTTFDYSLRYVWDLKAHTESWRYPDSGTVRRGTSSAPLNDQTAMQQCISEQGLGFLMVGGVAVADENGEFVAWHRERKAANGIQQQPSNSRRSRIRKSAFQPMHVEAFFFPNAAALDSAQAAGQVSGFRQGRQAPSHSSEGRIRRPKYKLAVNLARGSALEVGRLDW